MQAEPAPLPPLGDWPTVTIHTGVTLPDSGLLSGAFDHDQLLVTSQLSISLLSDQGKP